MNIAPTYNGFSGYINKVDSNTMLPSSSQFPETPNEYQLNQPSPDFDFLSRQFPIPPESSDLVPPASVSKDGESLYRDQNSLQIPTFVSHDAANSYYDESIFKFMNQMLMEEEDIGPTHIMSYDPLAFRVTERSFYDILGQRYPVTPTTQQSEQPLFVDQANQQPLYDGGRFPFGETISDSTVNQFLSQNIFTYRDSVMQFQRGLEEASKFLPNINPLVIDLESSKVIVEGQEHAPNITDKKDRSEMMNLSNKRWGRRSSLNGSYERKKSPNSSRGKKHQEPEDVESGKVERNEKLAVSCMYRFKHLMDETVEESSPRDSVLNLIRSLKPDIFVHSIINGAYNSPFFVPRFREALFHYSSVFDWFDVTMLNNPERFYFEKEFFGTEVMNVITCEGSDRNVRPETYKQWQVRTQRAGLKLLPLDQEITKSYRDMFKEKYHKDFKIEQGGDWLLQGWKGRITYATSCWVPA